MFSSKAYDMATHSFDARHNFHLATGFIFSQKVFGYPHDFMSLLHPLADLTRKIAIITHRVYSWV